MSVMKRRTAGARDGLIYPPRRWDDVRDLEVTCTPGVKFLKT